MVKFEVIKSEAFHFNTHNSHYNMTWFYNVEIKNKDENLKLLSGR